MGVDDDNYLMPRMSLTKEDEPALVYTPVLGSEIDGKINGL
jgi:hypothetical protein